MRDSPGGVTHPGIMLVYLMKVLTLFITFLITVPGLWGV